ncbi:hypothetical protein GCM10009639_40910 [Kitasatospora putterlickiae]|uniref:Uncharacterized protein n=1 Tax=Kitasatospora putterlickiae TaxID=221725 RepID=A0ABP4IYE0_9ACTN
MVVPFGRALERRSRTTYRLTVTLEESTHVDTAFTGTTSLFSRTASGTLAAPAVARQSILSQGPAPAPHEVLSSRRAPAESAGARRSLSGARGSGAGRLSATAGG